MPYEVAPSLQLKDMKEPLMTDKEPHALIPVPSGGLANISSGPKNILSGILTDTLALARQRGNSLTAARFRIGDYDFRDPDYRQILIWAKALELEPAVLIRGLEDNSEIHPELSFQVVDGSIRDLNLHCSAFPILSVEWVSGLRIKHLTLRGAAPAKVSLSLPLLNYLDCHGIGLTELDLSKVPALESLNCSRNQFVELDLSKVPALRNLWCQSNQLTELDLSKVPALKYLDCSSNQFVELDLSMVPALEELWCAHNQLAELDLSKVPALKKLVCGSNPFKELNLSTVPALTDLDCRYNQITDLDIRFLKKLKRFSHYPTVAFQKLSTQNF